MVQSTILKKRYGEKTKLRLIQNKRGLFGRGGIGAGIAIDKNIGAQAVDEAVLVAEEKATLSRFGL